MFFVFFLKDPLSRNNANPLSRNKDKECSLQVFIMGLAAQGTFKCQSGSLELIKKTNPPLFQISLNFRLPKEMYNNFGEALKIRCRHAIHNQSTCKKLNICICIIG